MKKILTEKEIEKTYEVLTGFNDSRNRRFEVGNFVTEKDFAAKDWKALLQMNAVKLVENPVGEDE